MAIQKFQGLRIGNGDLLSKNIESEIFVSNLEPNSGTVSNSPWNSSTSYSLGQNVTYLGRYWTSLTAGNLGNQPDTSPANWEEVHGKDGDIWIKVPADGFPTGGPDAQLYIKASSEWVPLSDTNPFTAYLNDNQVAADTAFEYPLSLFPYAEITYTIRRDTIPALVPSYGKYKQGKYKVLYNGVDVDWTHEFSEVGNDVGVSISFDVNSGKVRARYTSSSQSQDIELRYIIRGWAASVDSIT